MAYLYIRGGFYMQTNDQVFFQGNNNKAVLLIHGITSGAAQMIPMARFLNDYGYSVWLPDMEPSPRSFCTQAVRIS